METTESVYASCLNVVLQAAAAANVESDILLHEAGIDRSVLSIPGERSE